MCAEFAGVGLSVRAVYSATAGRLTAPCEPHVTSYVQKPQAAVQGRDHTSQRTVGEMRLSEGKARKAQATSR